MERCSGPTFSRPIVNNTACNMDAYKNIVMNYECTITAELKIITKCKNGQVNYKISVKFQIHISCNL